MEKINSSSKVAYFYAYEISMVLVVMEGKIAYVTQCGKIRNSLFWEKFREINLQSKTIFDKNVFT